AAPQLLVLVEQAARDAQLVEIAADDFAASDALLRDQAGPLENCDMLLDRREAHRVVAGQLEDALLSVDRPADDVAPRVIRQGAEHAVEVGRSDLHRYNHTVVSPAASSVGPPCSYSVGQTTGRRDVEELHFVPP